MNTPLIQFKNVSKQFGDKLVLDSMDLSIYPGEVTSLVGMSGSGKSVTLKLIIGLLKPDKGDILFQGKPLQEMSSGEKREMKLLVNFMFQNNALFDSMNIFENVALPLSERGGMKREEIRTRVEDKIKLLDLQGTMDKYPSQISGGMQKRVALARALVNDPQVVLFDEPTTGLDPTRKNSVLSMITHNQKDFGFTAVLVSHDVPDVFYISNRVAIIEEGKIIYQGTPDDLEQSDHELVHEFINSQSSLENEVMGLENPRGLETAYRSALNSGILGDRFVAILYTVQNFSRIQETVGILMAHNVIATLSRILNSRLSGENTILGRCCEDRILCILPEIGIAEAESLVSDISSDLQRQDFMWKTKYVKKC
ncbi:MAG: ABC transporter ATP-binding protein, partial [Thermodesulfobacteriota bacterium]